MGVLSTVMVVPVHVLCLYVMKKALHVDSSIHLSHVKTDFQSVLRTLEILSASFILLHIRSHKL